MLESLRKRMYGRDSTVLRKRADGSNFEAFTFDDVQCQIDRLSAALLIGEEPPADLRAIVVRVAAEARCPNHWVDNDFTGPCKCLRHAAQAALAASPRVGAPDLTNHHNALACPYCNPDNLSLSKQPPTESVKAINEHRVGSEPPQATKTETT